MATNNAINNPGNSFLTPANNLSDVTTPATARLNLFVPLSVNTGTVLTAADYGKEVICTGAVAYALTLPTVTSNANKFIDVFCQTTSNAIVTITPASGTIAGQTTLRIGSGDGVRIMNDGTNWWVLNQWLQPVNFSVALSPAQSIPDNTITVVNYNAADFNIGGFFDLVTNHNFIPLLPGKYYFYHSIEFAPFAGAPLPVKSGIRKNGSRVSGSSSIFQANNQVSSLPCDAIIAMNGTTDTVDGIAFQNSGGALNVQVTSSNLATRMFGNRISLF